MGIARLAKVTIVAPRSEYDDVAKALAQFEDFHPVEGDGGVFDPSIQEILTKAVRLFATADQAVKDLGLQLMPGQIDLVFRGVKVTQTDFDAGNWDELLTKAEAQLAPIAQEVRMRKVSLLQTIREETDAENQIGVLKVVSDFSSDLGALSELKVFKAIVALVANERLAEFRNALPDAIFLSQPVSKEQALALVAVGKTDEGKLDKVMKLLELKPFVIPAGKSQNPAEAFRKAIKDHDAAVTERKRIEAEMTEIGLRDGTALLAVRELTEVVRKMLDEVRVSGSMERLAVTTGYIPAGSEARLREMFGRWLVYTEEVGSGAGEEHVPTLMQNKPGLTTFQQITKEQGIPGGKEVDPTPIVAFVFPIFFGLMFGDVGHGLILTLFSLLVKKRGIGSMKQWGNIFLVAGISATIFGIIFGEFFELSLYSFVPIPAVIEIIHRAAGSPDTFNINGVYLVMEVSILIGVAHLTTALGLNVYEGMKEHDRFELLLKKVPVLTMYVSGVGYGLAFIGAGFSFNVLKVSTPAPLLGIPNNMLGGLSLAVLLPSMLVLLAGKSVVIALGKVKGGSAMGALANGGLEVFERITQFLSNTVSYVRLAVMLFVHAALLLITNQYFGPWINPVYVVPWVLLNLLILSFEGFIVYVQDLRLHLYEFFTKFFVGTGTPFRKILPDRARIRINWH
jgi:V/A-type H+-transporting ATPase subunit I